MAKRFLWPLAMTLLLVASSPGLAQTRELGLRAENFRSLGVPALPSVNCSQGVVVDDGVFESGYALDGTPDPAVRFVMRLDSQPGLLEQICICLRRSGSDDVLTGAATVWDNDGIGGAPGTLLGSVALLADNIPAGGTPRFYDVDASSEGILTDGSVYVGLSYIDLLETGIFICADETGAEKSPGYVRFDDAPDDNSPWGRLGTIGGFDDDYSALGVRAQVQGTVGNCAPGSTTLCLTDGRFRVTVSFNTPQGDSGVGQAVELTNDTGYFWFFSETNVEMVVKVLDACSFADRFWVFAGGLTDVEVEIRVEDTETGVVQTYENPQQTPFQPIQDTQGFATCP